MLLIRLRNGTTTLMLVHNMDSIFLKKQLILDIEEAMRFRDLNMEFMDENAFLTRWLLNYCATNHIEPPNLDKLQDLIRKCGNLIERMNRPYTRSDDRIQPAKNEPSDEEEDLIRDFD